MYLGGSGSSGWLMIMFYAGIILGACLWPIFAAIRSLNHATGKLMVIVWSLIFVFFIVLYGQSGVWDPMVIIGPTVIGITGMSILLYNWIFRVVTRNLPAV